MSRPKISSTKLTSQVPPCVPFLYFDHHPSFELSTSFTTREPIILPTEIVSVVTSFLNWGDYIRLSRVQSSLKSIVKDATEFVGPDAKWSLAEFLLESQDDFGNLLQPITPIELLEDLAGLRISANGDMITKSNAEDPVFYQAMRKLATCYLTGRGIDQNVSLGLRWLQVAFEHGDVEAAFETAKIYELGSYDTPVDVVKATQWFELAARGGHVEGMVEYAMCLELGCGVELNEEAALEWYTRAAELGHITANYSVGEMFEEARGGVPQSDVVMAVYWYYKAAVKGDEDSKKALARLSDIARIIIPGWASELGG